MKSITTKIIALTVGLTLLTTIGLMTVSLRQFTSMADSQSALLEKTLNESFDRSIRWEIETAHSMLARLDTLKKDGELTPDQAENVAKKLLRDLRYDTEGYFWADTADGTNVILLGKDQQGKNRLNSVDANGTAFVKDILAAGQREGGGYSNYWFPKAGTDVPLPKRSYSLLSKPWGWIIGTGAYVDDIAVVVREKGKKPRGN